MVPLKEVLEKRFGSDFPIGAGSTKRDDPLVITDKRDYVSIEYEVAKFLLEHMGFEYEFEQQRTHNYEGRVVDELVYAAKETGKSEWTQTRRFFFDITAGFNRTDEVPDEEAPDEDVPDEEELRRQFNDIQSAISPDNKEYFRRQKELALADVDSDVRLLKLLRVAMALGAAVLVGGAVVGKIGWILAIALCLAFILIIQFIVRPILFTIKKRKFGRAMSNLSDEHYGR